MIDELMTKDTLLFNLLLAALATLPTHGFTSFLAAHCDYYKLPQPLHVCMSDQDHSQLNGTPRELWERGNPKQRLMLILRIDAALEAMRKQRAN